MIPLFIFDRSRLSKASHYIVSSNVTDLIELSKIRLLRAYLETETCNIVTNGEVRNVPSTDDPTPRFLTHSFGKTLFKRYMIMNAIYSITQLMQVVIIYAVLHLKVDSTVSSIESDILPHRVLCVLFSNNMGQQNIDLYQCTLPSQYRILRTFIVLIGYLIIATVCNIICLIQSVYVYCSSSQRQRVWIPYYHAQCVIPFNIIQARHFVNYIGCDGHYIFTILQKHMNDVIFQRFFDLFVEMTFRGTYP
jgi:hypothetical protein